MRRKMIGDFISKVSFEMTKPEKSGKVHKKLCSTVITFTNRKTWKEQRKTKPYNFLDISDRIPLFLDRVLHQKSFSIHRKLWEEKM